MALIIFLLLSLFPVGDVGNIESSLKRTGEKAGCNVRVSPHTAKYTFANDKKQVFLPLKYLITSTVFMKNYIGNLYNRKTYLIKILNNLTLAKKYFQKNAGK